MKMTFAGWYPKSPEQLKSLWDNALIIPDTNILLHLLRHSAEVRSQLMEVFERKRDSLWIPYQVGIEFQRRRLDVQQHTFDAYARLEETIGTFVNQARNSVNQYRAHPVLDIEQELALLENYLSAFKERMVKAKANHPLDEFDASFAKVTELFAGKVGQQPTADWIGSVHKQGAERYAKKIPPGFEDAKKSGEGGDKFGDLLIWMAMIEKAQTDKRPIIFVTDDGKSDWWYIHRGRKIGPHPALVEEFLTLTGQNIHIYELLQFLRYAAGTGSKIREESVQKIAETLASEADADASTASANGVRSPVSLRVELRAKEAELDALIKSLIDFPPTLQQATRQENDARHALKSRISELTGLVNAIREQLDLLQGDSMIDAQESLS